MTSRRTSTAGVALVALALAATSISSAAQAASAPTAAPTAGTAAAPRPAAAAAKVPQLPKSPTRIGYGGAVTSVDPDATRVGLRVLKQGGTAVDAAVAAAATLGVTEPFSAGIGGGGYFVSYDAKSGKVRTIDGRETAPLSITKNAFIDPDTDEPYEFTPDLVTSGVSVGVPGTPATWEKALDQWGTYSLRQALAPATKLARKGFVVDKTFRSQTNDNRLRFKAFTSTKKLYLDGGLPKVGTRFKNPDLADTYDILATKGVRAFYRGPLAGEIVDAVRKPPKTKGTKLPVPTGFMKRSDLKRYQAINQKPTRISYRGHQVFGMRPSSSGGSTVGEALNILEQYDLGAMTPADALHHYLEASALAFADRGEYVGDAAFVDVPLQALLSPRYAAERACSISPTTTLPKPTSAGDVSSYDGLCSTPSVAASEPAEDTENISTTNITVADKFGNVVEYTLTIEQTGGSGIVVPGRGFLLNNELTDFSTEYDRDDPNRIQPGKRPRSSMSPTIVLKNGKPFLALGSPGGSTIITTVLQLLFDRIDRGMTIQQAMAEPRASERNFGNITTAEPEFIAEYAALLTPYGHQFESDGDTFTSDPFIGAATAIEFGPKGLMTAVAEPVRRGGGAAGVVRQRRN